MRYYTESHFFYLCHLSFQNFLEIAFGTVIPASFSAYIEREEDLKFTPVEQLVSSDNDDWNCLTVEWLIGTGGSVVRE